MTDYVCPLLKQLQEAKRLSAKHKWKRPMFMDNMLKKMERELMFINDIFRRLERWENDVKEALSVLARFLDDMLDDGCYETRGLEFQLQSIDCKISDLKEHVTPPLRLPPLATDESIPSSLTKTDALQEFAFVGRNPGLPLHVSYVWQKYEKMRPQLRECLLTLVIFPKVSVIKKRLMSYWWIGEGIVKDDKSGELCFQELINEGLITPIYKAHNLVADRCMMPLWVRDELSFIAMMVDAFSYGSPGLPSSLLASSSRAVLVQGSEEPEQSIAVSPRFNPNKFQTCFNANQRNLVFGKEFILMRNAAVLQLGRWQSSALEHHIEVKNTKFLEWLDFFKNLRYLSLRGISRMTELPGSIGELANLKILDLQGCQSLEKLPVGITKLKSLTHLDLSECCLLEHMPKGLGSLPELQVLKGFVINKDQVCQLQELAKLEKLRKLDINIKREAMIGAGELDELCKLTTLRSLKLTWEQDTPLPPKVASVMNTELVSPPPNLEKLELCCFPLVRPPSWLDPCKLMKLKRLYIWGGRLHNLCLGSQKKEAYHVEVLRLKFLQEWDLEESDLLIEFPYLTFLEITECNKLTNTSRCLHNNSETEDGSLLPL